ncbi:hypothetical protein [Jiella sonneratiae]|uniref:Uncharacterized protein n=1 Tax=Jiella sonneratiae TaxID=2816856 RepID=A0ABS3JA15_9HYPH|nr:hypothetical protein [Jiella sonneratiae]MBO0906522.1 hypothetical protein [Jiella sonneratiae]
MTTTPSQWCGYRDGIVIPGVGTVRLLDNEAQVKAKYGPKHTRADRELYLAVGMNAWQWKKMRLVDKRKVRWAFMLLTAPTNCGRKPEPVDWSAWPADERA